MKALKQGVMKFARDACALSDARLQRHVELMVQLPQPQLVGRPQQRQEEEARTERETSSYSTKGA